METISEKQSIPTTSREVLVLMGKLGFPNQFSNTVMSEISKKEGRKFSSALADIANNEPSATAKRDYIEAVCSAVSPHTTQVLKRIGFHQFGLAQLIDISIEEGKIFRKSILAAESSSDARCYIEQVLNMAFACGGFDSIDQHQVGSLPTDAPCHEHGDIPPMEVPSSPHIAAPRAPNCPPAQEISERKFESHRIYGGKNAFCFSLDVTLGENKPTVRIEAARAIREKQYDWSKKLGFQLRVSELPLVYGVFAGLLSKIELNSHGMNNEKSLTIEDQGEKYFLSLRTKGASPFAIPAQTTEIFMPMSLIWRQLQANTPNIESAILLQMITNVCQKHAMKQPSA